MTITNFITESVLKDTLKSVYEGLDKSIRPMMHPPYHTINQTDTAWWLDNFDALTDGSNETDQGKDQITGATSSKSSKSNSVRLF